MARYQYTARDIKGGKIEGVLEAPSNLAVVTRLRNQNLFPVDISLAGQKGFSSSAKKNKAVVKRGRVKLKELSVFTRQTATMLAAGISIIELLDDLSEQTANRYFSQVL